MSTTEKNTAAKGGWLKKLGIAGIGLFGLLAMAYFVCTSAWFLKSIVLPKVSKAINATLTVDDASISPFSSIKLSGLKLQTTGPDPAVSANEASVRYPSLFDLIGGKINLDEIILSGVKVKVVINADGTSNLDPLYKSSSSQPSSTPAKKSETPLQLAIRKVALTDASITVIKADQTGGKIATETTGINITLEDLGNGKTANLGLSSTIKFAKSQNEIVRDGLMSALKGDLKIALDARLVPTVVNGGISATVSQATGAFKEINDLAINVTADWTPTQIKGVSAKFNRAGQSLGAVAISGPLDINKMEGKLKGDITAIDRQVLNLVGAAFGIDFNSTTLNSSGEIELAQGGKVIHASGTVNAARLSVTQLKQTTPELDVEIKYNLAVTQPGPKVVIQTFGITGLQNRSEIIRGGLSRPMTIDLGGTGGAVDESAFDLAIKNLNLADWRAFAAGTEPAGKLDLKLNLVSQKAGQKLLVDLNTTVNNFSAKYGSNRLDQADLSLAVNSSIENLQQTRLNSFTARIAHRQQPVLNLSGSGSFNSTNLDTDVQTRLEVFLPRLAEFAAMPELKMTQGSLSFDGHLAQKNLNPAQTNHPPFDRALTGQLRLADMSGNFRQFQFDRFNAAADCDIAVKNDVADIKKLKATLSQSGQAGGNVEVTGQYNLAKTNGQVTLRLADLNQNIFKSFAALLAPNKLESVSISAALDAQIDPQADTGARGEVQIANLLITDPSGQLPRTPMTAEAKLDVNMKNQRAEIRQMAGTIKQGQLSGGSFDMKGSYDLIKTNGQFSLQLADLNQNTLRPLLAAKMGQRTLESVSINVNASGQVDMAGESNLRGEFKVANLLVTDPQGQFPKTPMTAEVKLDAGYKNQLAEIRQFTGSIKQGQINGGDFDVKGSYNLAKTNGQFSLQLADLNQNALRPLLAANMGKLTLESVSINVNASGKLDMAGESNLRGEFKVANLLVTDPQGQFPKTPMTAEMKLDAGLKNQLAEIRQFTGTIKQGQNNGGSFDAKGSYNLAKTNGQFALQLADLNQNALRPLLASSLGDMTLETVSINANANGKVDGNGDSDIKGEFKVVNLLIRDPKGQMPANPVTAQLNLDASCQKQMFDLRNLGLQLTPTARGSNYVTLAGKVNLAKSNAITGALRLTSDSLDITPYYDLFANRPAAKAAAANPPAPKSASNEEPQPVTMPFTNFTFDANVGRFFLREIAVSNFVTNLKLDGSVINLSNLQFALNGAPVKGRLLANLGVPGYIYDVDLNAPRLALTPFVLSFSPALHESLKGELTAGIAMKGAGVTGKNMRDKLSGNLALILTNATIIPKGLLVSDQGRTNKALGNWVSVLMFIGQALQIPNVTAEPIDAAVADLQIGGGQINLRRVNLHSTNLIVECTGAIPIADVLNDSSLNLPMEVLLSRRYATAILGNNVSTQATHVKLPQFVTVKGTLGAPDTKINKVALIGMAASQVGRVVGGGNTGGILQGIGNILGGNTAAVTNAPSVQPNNLVPATQSNTNTPRPLLQNLLPQPANPPPSTQTNRPAVTPGDLLNDLLKPRPRR